MGKKKGKGKGKKAGPVGPDGETLVENYKKACKMIGEEPSIEFMSILDAMIAEGEIISQICAADLPLGPAGVRCVAAALMGEMPGMEGGMYFNLTNLHLWRCGAKDDGTIAIAKLLKNQEKDFKVGVLDLMDNGIGLRGMTALGKSLADGGNLSLLTLNLNINHFEPAAVSALADGLRSNRTLKKLSLEYCGLSPATGPILAGLLASPTCGLTKLLLRGNHLRCDGLKFISLALRKNKILQELDLEDNEIGWFPPKEKDVKVLATLATHLTENTSLTTLNLNMNPLSEIGADAFKEGVAGNKTITALSVDIALPEVVFDALYRAGGGKKGKKGKKKKKKK